MPAAMLRQMSRGALLALASAALFGASTPVAKALLGAARAVAFRGALYLGSGAAWFHRFARDRGREAPLAARRSAMARRDVLSGGVIGPVLLMFGLARTPASTAALLLNLEGVATMAIAWVVFRENVDRRICAGAAAILLALLLSWTGPAQKFGWAQPGDRGGVPRLGDRQQPHAQAFGRRSDADGESRGSSRAPSTSRSRSASAPRGPARPRSAAAGLVGFIGYGVSLMCFVLALRHLGTARTGAYFSLAPFVGAALGVAVFGEPVTPVFLAAAGLMAMGVWLHLTERHVHEHAHDTQVHEHAHVHDAHHRHAHAADDPPGEPHSHSHAMRGSSTAIRIFPTSTTGIRTERGAC